MTSGTHTESHKRLPSDSELVRFIGSQVRNDGLTVDEVARFAGAAVHVTFGARLKFRREQENRTLEDCARVCGFSRQAIATWEKGGEPRRLTPEALAKLATYLHCTPEWLLQGVGVEDVPDSADGGAAPAVRSDLRPLLETLRSAEDELRQTIRKIERLIGG